MSRFDTYRKRQDREFISDFAREIKRIQGKRKQERTPYFRNRILFK